MMQDVMSTTARKTLPNRRLPDHHEMNAEHLRMNMGRWGDHRELPCLQLTAADIVLAYMIHHIAYCLC